MKKLVILMLFFVLLLSGCNNNIKQNSNITVNLCQHNEIVTECELCNKNDTNQLQYIKKSVL